MDYMQLIIISVLIEAIWENLKMIWKDKKINVNMLGVLILSIIICLVTKADIFPVVGITVIVPVVGSILTGIIVARGANFVNDLIGRIKGKGEK